MDKDNSKIVLLGESHSAKYSVLFPDFERRDFIETEEFKEANKLTFSGFLLILNTMKKVMFSNTISGIKISTVAIYQKKLLRFFWKSYKKRR